MTHTQQSASPTIVPLTSDWQKTAAFPLSCWERAGVKGKRLLAAALLLISPAAFAQLPGLISQPLANGGQSWSLPVQTLVLLTSLSFLPAMLLMMTSFTRIIIVLGLLRNALGTPSAPPNQVMLGLALFLTFFIMSPVFDKV